MSKWNKWMVFGKRLAPRQERFVIICSFLLPLLVWCLISYVTVLWHPLVEVQDAGDSFFLNINDRVERDVFEKENQQLELNGQKQMVGKRVNPVYLPAPHKVALALIESFTTPPQREGDPWLYQSILHSIMVVFKGFLFSSLIGVPLGILCGFFSVFSKLFEPFIEFFRYFPAPVFGALAVAVLGINDAPKVAIIFIGTFSQQVLIMSNTVRQVDFSLVEAAQTLGCRHISLLKRVVIPASLPKLYTDMRILLGWAWTYLIVAEVIGTSTGISWFINQQAKYRIFENVYAAIFILGLIGLGTDMLLARLGYILFSWERGEHRSLFKGFIKNIAAKKEIA